MLSKQQPGRRTCLCYRQPKTTAVASWHRTKGNKLYDIMKDSTDIVDQRMAFHTSKTKSRRWTMVVLAYMIDTAHVNFSTIYALNKNVDSTIPSNKNIFSLGLNWLCN
jgi:hypothetical protein